MTDVKRIGPELTDERRARLRNRYPGTRHKYAVVLEVDLEAELDASETDRKKLAEFEAEKAKMDAMFDGCEFSFSHGDPLALAMHFGRELAEERAGRIARDGWAITAFAAAAKNGGYLSAEECQALPKTPEPKQCPPIPGVDQNRPLSQDGEE